MSIAYAHINVDDLKLPFAPKGTQASGLSAKHDITNKTVLFFSCCFVVFNVCGGGGCGGFSWIWRFKVFELILLFSMDSKVFD